MPRPRCSPPREESITRWLTLCAIALAALNLRTAVASLSPLLAFVTAEIPLSTTSLALLGTLPPLCFAIGAFLAPALFLRISLEQATLISLGTLALGLAGRAFSTETPSLLLSSALTFMAIGVLNVLFPPLVKKHFPRRGGAVTTLYVTLMTVGTFLAPLIAVPFAVAWGWRASLLIWAILAAAALILWIPLAWHRSRPSSWRTMETPAPAPRAVGLFRSPLAWGVCALCAAPGFTAYAMFAWYPTMLVETAGSSAAEAGTLLALYAAMGTPGALLLPLAAARGRAISILVFGCGTCFVVGFSGMIFAPAAGVWCWALFCGAGQLLFPISLFLMNARARTTAGAARLSSMAQGAAYLFAATGPIIVGFLYEATADWTLPLIVLIVIAIIGTTVGMIAVPRRFIEDEPRRPHRV